MVKDKSKVLIIYTGGTIGMVRDEKKGTLKPFRMSRMTKSVPSILDLGIEIHALELEEVIDSSNVTPEVWSELAGIIGEHYAKFDGFVVLHGSDTMAFSASALSFMLENLAKPVVFTGSQLPLGLPRTDARENLITALEIAALRNDLGQSLIPEVCIYFEDRLYRGNRTHKFNSENFDAFLSLNYPILAEAGVKIEVFEHRLLPIPTEPFRVHEKLNTNVAVLTLFPGMNYQALVEMFISTKVELIILETYGAGNGPTSETFLNGVKTLLDDDVLVVNVTQCRQGHVEMEKYEASAALAEMGIIGLDDITIEAAITKAMFVLGQTENKEERKHLMQTVLRGEIST
jgi:L-asparaginase